MKTKEEKINQLSRKLLVASDPSRLKILCALFHSKNSCVSDIAEQLQVSVAIASHHLQSLAKEGILNAKRDGKKVCYSLSREPFVSDLKKFICKFK